jgi:hypothetical protein
VDEDKGRAEQADHVEDAGDRGEDAEDQRGSTENLHGVFVQNGGFELVLALFAGLAVIALLGAGKFSVDGLIGRTAAAR